MPGADFWQSISIQLLVQQVSEWLSLIHHECPDMNFGDRYIGQNTQSVNETQLGVNETQHGVNETQQGVNETQHGVNETQHEVNETRHGVIETQHCYIANIVYHIFQIHN